jgi:2-dehydro-3-deoxyphosphogalactonate aldolase
MSRNIIAILRGIESNEVLEISKVIANSGINYIEVALNSPDAFESIRLLRNKFSGDIKIGAGTVTKIGEVLALSRLGVDFIVSPNFDPGVVKATKEAMIISYPGVTTASECYSAIHCGADGLKFFPASLLGIENFKVLKAILPKDIPFYMVGGVGPEDFSSWFSAGATGFGIGSGIYKAGDSSQCVAMKAEQIVQSYDEAKND